MNKLAPTSTSHVCRGIASFGDVELQTISALAIDSARTQLAIGQYFYPRQGVVLLDVPARCIRWQSDWAYSSSDDIDALAFSRDGRRVWVALSDGSLRCFGADDGELKKRTERCAGDSISDVRLSRDARFAVAQGSWDRSTGWSGPPVDMNEYFTTLITADATAGEVDKAREPALIDAILATTTGRHALLRFKNVATLAISPDAKLDLVSVVKGHEAAPQLLVRDRASGRNIDTLTFHRPGDFALAATFTDDSKGFWVGTQSGLLFGYAL
jgi:hypothetical protein